MLPSSPAGVWSTRDFWFRDVTVVVGTNARSTSPALIAAKSGVTQAEAEGRVDDAYARGLQAADTARKAVAHSMYWTFLALLVGAFFASVGEFKIRISAGTFTEARTHPVVRTAPLICCVPDPNAGSETAPDPITSPACE